MRYREEFTCGRCRFDRLASDLRGSRILGISYFRWNDDDVDGWDFGPLHSVATGVELLTDRGPFCFALTEASPATIGLDVHDRPLAELMPVRVGGPVGVCPEDHPEWRQRIGHVIKDISLVWPPRWDDFWAVSWSLPVAARIETTAGPFWVVAGCVAPDGSRGLVPGDEVVLAFSPEALATLDGRLLQLRDF